MELTKRAEKILKEIEDERTIKPCAYKHKRISLNHQVNETQTDIEWLWKDEKERIHQTTEDTFLRKTTKFTTAGPSLSELLFHYGSFRA